MKSPKNSDLTQSEVQLCHDTVDMLHMKWFCDNWRTEQYPSTPDVKESYEIEFKCHILINLPQLWNMGE